MDENKIEQLVRQYCKENNIDIKADGTIDARHAVEVARFINRIKKSTDNNSKNNFKVCVDSLLNKARRINHEPD